MLIFIDLLRWFPLHSPQAAQRYAVLRRHTGRVCITRHKIRNAFAMPAGQKMPRGGALMGTSPTIWCTIQRVQPLPPWRRAGVKVTVADRAGTAVTVALTTSDLDSYASFQAAVLRATGHPFHYLPGTVPRCSPEAKPTWLPRISGCRPVAMLHKLTTVPLVLKSVVKRVLVGSNAVSAE